MLNSTIPRYSGYGVQLSGAASQWAVVSVPIPAASSFFAYHAVRNNFQELVTRDDIINDSEIGAALTSAASVDAVRNGDGTNFYVDPVTKRAYVKLYGTQNGIAVCSTARCL